MTRCVECDESFEGSFDEHCKTEEHELNWKVNRVVQLMEGLGLDFNTLRKVLKHRPLDSNHGRLIGP